MFNDFQKDELISRLRLILEQNRAGRADDRNELAERLVEATREYLATQYSSKPIAGGPPGVIQSNDIPDE